MLQTYNALYGLLMNLSFSRVPTLAVWGGVGGVALVYFTDWRLILDYVPYINGKFKKDD
uniref:Ubiquinol-cytochrome c reductase, complex III subunit XI n=1 Tax=Sinocyclocheilus anshuiensis TaxID=1608454 RepID=A0A671MM52_9TELE